MPLRLCFEPLIVRSIRSVDESTTVASGLPLPQFQATRLPFANFCVTGLWIPGPRAFNPPESVGGVRDAPVMSIDITIPSAPTVEDWRSVLHEVLDEVLDRMLLTAEWEFESGLDDDGLADDELGEPPGDPPQAPDPPDPPDLPDLAGALSAGLAAAIERGTRVWGCDGTLRCTHGWVAEVADRPEGVLAAYRRTGRFCDCDVLLGIRGRTGTRPRCPRRQDGPATSTGRGS